jgi:hypothetical protein
MTNRSSPVWRISSACVNSDCVAVAMMPDGEVWMRRSSDDDGAVLRFSAVEWREFVAGVRNGFAPYE